MSLGDNGAADNNAARIQNNFDSGSQANFQQQETAANGRFAAEVMPNIGAPMSIASLNGGDLSGYSAFNSGGAGADADNPNNPGRKLDKSKSVDQLMAAGVIAPVENTLASTLARGANSANGDAALPASEKLKTGETPEVTVTYSDANTGPNQKAPDFIVKQDGSIQASGDPTKADKKDIVIQVERAPGSPANPEASQQQSIDGLVNYLYGRMSDNPTVAQKGLQLNDQYGLISNDVSQQVSRPDATDPAAAAADTAVARQNYSAPTQQAMSQASRFTPGSSGSMTRSDMSHYVPERAEPRLHNESDSVADIKNAIAGEFKPDAATRANSNAPYETSRMDRRGATEVPAVGRYGMTFQLFRGWFKTNLGVDDDLDDGNIVARMDALAKRGKISKEFAQKFHNHDFAQRFVHAMHEMKEGHTLSQADMKDLMPAKFQEQVAADMVGKYAQTAGGDSGKTALAFHLGKEPGELTAAELADKGNKEYMQTASKFGQISHLRDNMGANDTADYSVSKDGSMLDAKIKRVAASTAAEVHSEHGKGGFCAEGVQRAWAKAGFPELLGSGDGWAMHVRLDHDPNFAKVDRETALAAVRAGHVAIVTRHWSENYNGKDSGHVETLMANNRGQVTGTSDFQAAHVVNNPRYNKDYYYLPKADLQNA